MPASFYVSADKIRLLTDQAKDGLRGPLLHGALDTATEQLFRSLESIRLAIRIKSSLLMSLEYNGIIDDLVWWVTEQPQAVVRFARKASEEVHASLGGHAYQRRLKGEAFWKLDALQGIYNLKLEQHMHLSVRRRLKTEVGMLQQLLEVRAL